MIRRRCLFLWTPTYVTLCPVAAVRELDPYEAKVCFKLFRQGCFGKGHKLTATVTSGFPSHELDGVKARPEFRWLP